MASGISNVHLTPVSGFTKPQRHSFLRLPLAFLLGETGGVAEEAAERELRARGAL